MALAHHLDISLQAQQQQAVTREYIIPFIRRVIPVGPGTRVLDIGCGVGGVLLAFVEEGCTGVGVDLDEKSIRTGNALHAERIARGELALYHQNVYDWDTTEQFDLIVFKDSIEHIPDQARIIAWVKRYLKPGGHIFFGFPPWVMPFGGHQQVIRNNRCLAKLPWYHLLPMPLYQWVLRKGGVEPGNLDFLVETKQLGISTWRFERIVRRTGYRIARRRFWLFNPIYRYKFGLKPRTQGRLLYPFPGLRDFFTTGAYYLIRPR
ncbi:MAG: class I SAM-dependent methyltransferase [Bacteroidetes bacterium]|nr:class I SAM-dependent methyltransferase [Bacteroidota bacterium]